jgi:hypothetical protein
VDEARASRRDEQRAHQELLASHQKQLDAASSAHRQEIEQRAAALEAERRIEVIRALRRVATDLLDLADCARQETIEPPATLSELTPIPLTRIPGLLAALRTSVQSVEALGGPRLSVVTRITDQGYNVGLPSMQFVGEAFDGLREVEDAMRRLGSEPPEP